MPRRTEVKIVLKVDYKEMGRILEEAAQAFLRRFSTQTSFSPEIGRYLECAEKRDLKNVSADMPTYVFYERCDDIIAAWAEHWLQYHGKAYLSTTWFVDELKNKIMRKTLARERMRRNATWRRKIAQEVLGRRE